MHRRQHLLRFYLIGFSIVLAQDLQAQRADLVGAADHFLETLQADGRTKARYAFDDDERFDWGYVPRSRNGAAMKELSPVQRQAALDLLRASVSIQGYEKATAIMQLENVLREMEGRGTRDTYRDPLNYSLTIFGTPSDTSLWGWRLEGHHLSLNFSSSSREIVSGTPSFWGTNPAIVPGGPEKGKQILKQEMDLGFALVNALSPAQLMKALITGVPPSDIVTGSDRKAELLHPEGIAYDELTDAQQGVLRQLLDVYVKNYTAEFSDSLMQRVRRAGIDHLHFAWAGSLKPVKGHYYRIQGPTILIEYDNTQNNANHVHAVVRDPTNDFAGDILLQHYRKDHHHRHGN